MTRDLAELDRDVEAARVVDQIERETGEAVRAGMLHTAALHATAALASLLTWWARRAR